MIPADRISGILSTPTVLVYGTMQNAVVFSFSQVGSGGSDLGFLVLQGFAQSDELSVLAVHSRLQAFHLHHIVIHVPVVGT